jgi:hypothetical protein
MLSQQGIRVLSDQELDAVSGGILAGGPIIVVDKNGVCINYGTTSDCYLPSMDNYSDSGEVYYSSQGLAFESYGACMDYYANQIHDENTSAVGSVFPLVDVVNNVIGNGDPTAADYDAAAEYCR